MPYDNFQHLQYKVLKKKMNEALGANFEKGSESKSEAKKVSNFVIVKPADVSMETTNEQSAVPE